jgi:hypothetical protein
MMASDLETDAQRIKQRREQARQRMPIRSDIRDGGFESRYWCATLDGRPVDHCRAFDTEAGWVEVYVVSEKRGETSLRSTSAVRVFGKVAAIWLDDWIALKQEVPAVEVYRAPTPCLGDV